jgi:hypothetical protein
MHPKLASEIKSRPGMEDIEPPPPSHQFKVGQKVDFGNLEGADVIDVSPDGKILLLEALYRSRDNPAGEKRLLTQAWFNVRKQGSREARLTTAELGKEDRLQFRTLNTSIGGVLLRVETAGVDFDPPYQRGLAWTLKQKQDLIETIFDRGAIGTLAFNRRPYTHNGKGFEVVDGKQRLHTLWEFIQDKFDFKGRLHSELHPRDQRRIDDHAVLVYDLEEANMATILRLFLRVNRKGTQVDEAHIDLVAQQLAEIEAKSPPVKKRTPGPTMD